MKETMSINGINIPFVGSVFVSENEIKFEIYANENIGLFTFLAFNFKEANLLKVELYKGNKLKCQYDAYIETVILNPNDDNEKTEIILNIGPWKS